MVCADYYEHMRFFSRICSVICGIYWCQFSNATSSLVSKNIYVIKCNSPSRKSNIVYVAICQTEVYDYACRETETPDFSQVPLRHNRWFYDFYVKMDTNGVHF